jgi:hypothetical protein
MLLNETCSDTHIGENLSDSFLIQNGLKQGDILSSLFFTFALWCAITEMEESKDR